jgi:hypothetical protein
MKALPNGWCPHCYKPEHGWQHELGCPVTESIISLIASGGSEKDLALFREMWGEYVEAMMSSLETGVDG